MLLLEEVKRSLEVEDLEGLDQQITDFIERTSKQLCVRLGFSESVPESLSYIVVECTIKRFNRKGNEGMSTYGQEGESIAYVNPLDEFELDIAAYKDEQKIKSTPRKGVAVFL